MKTTINGMEIELSIEEFIRLLQYEQNLKATPKTFKRKRRIPGA